MVEFKYHKTPVSSGVFIASNAECPVCLKRTTYSYIGPFYAYSEVDGICPDCINSGLAAQKYSAEFVDELYLSEDIGIEKKIELTTKTPGVFFPQEEVWPAHCDDFCQFNKYLNSIDIDYLINNRAEIERLCFFLELSIEDFISELNREYSPLKCLEFQCLNCGKIMLVANYE
ncbi:CbrC family protein [Photobacterium damselae subsp. damselae]|uniref:CbrC family protein n=1 Tax=Photobacterium damselae TaxID=38293 RepID=UPI00165E6CCE|nr:CbrC family protein [Photobacterium damselae]